MWESLLITAITGILGTGLGAVIAAFMGKRKGNVHDWLFAFSGGVMWAVVFFDLIPETQEMLSMWQAVLWIGIGALVIWGCSAILEKFGGGHVHSHGHEDHTHEEHSLAAHSKRAGLFLAVAVMLHNLPAGLAISSTYMHSATVGLSMAILIALHNIPEGIAISLPLMDGGVTKTKAVVYAMVSGAPTLLGGAIGAALGGVSETVLGAILGFAAGAMFMVMFLHIVAEAFYANKNKFAALFTMAGILFGFVIVSVLGH